MRVHASQSFRKMAVTCDVAGLQAALTYDKVLLSVSISLYSVAATPPSERHDHVD